MFGFTDSLGSIDVAVTDRDVDLRESPDRDRVRTALGLDALVAMHQVHGTNLAWIDDEHGSAGLPEADALGTDRRGLGLLVRVADCVPVVLAAPGEDLVAVVHAGRAGLVGRIVPRAVEALRARGASALAAWIGPHVCGRCYELPADLADAVATAVPAARSTTSWGTPAADLGAGVAAQLAESAVSVRVFAACTRDDDRFFSHRRGDAGRFGAVVVRR